MSRASERQLERDIAETAVRMTWIPKEFAKVSLILLDEMVGRLLKLRAEKQKMTVDEYIEWRKAEFMKDASDVF